mgnify:CR=1 FL=1
MLAGSDTQKDYVFTHMIHERLKDTATERVYSLYELRWRLRLVDGLVQGRLSHDPESEWMNLGLPDTEFGEDARDIAYGGLLALMPDLATKISNDVRAWLRRLATGATVVPIFMPDRKSVV